MIILSIARQIHETLKERILEEFYRPSQKLSEATLAQEFGCSRTPIRQVLQQLQKENLVTIVARSGTYVNEFRLQRSDVQVRAYLEGLAYRLCLETGKDTAPLVQKLKGLYRDMHESLSSFEGMKTRMKRYTKYHYQFHESIILFSENPLLSRLYSDLKLTDWPSFVKNMTLEDLAQTEEEHRKIIRYLECRASEGEQFMISHIYYKKLD